jgi:hypothetical protein
MSLTHLLNPNTPNNLNWADLNCNTLNANELNISDINVNVLTVNQEVDITSTSNQIKLGAVGNRTIINAMPLTTSRTYNIPDVGANSNFIISSGTQTIGGAKTFTSGATFSGGLNVETSGNLISGRSLILDKLVSGSNIVTLAPADSNKSFKFVKSVLAIPDNVATAVLSIVVPNNILSLSINVHTIASNNIFDSCASSSATCSISRFSSNVALVDVSSAYGTSQTAANTGIPVTTIAVASGSSGTANTIEIRTTVNVAGGATVSNAFLVFDCQLLDLLGATSITLQ